MQSSWIPPSGDGRVRALVFDGGESTRNAENEKGLIGAHSIAGIRGFVFLIPSRRESIGKT
jgi:hypothetical protein